MTQRRDYIDDRIDVHDARVRVDLPDGVAAGDSGVDQIAFQFGAAQDFSVAFWFKHPFDASPDHTSYGGSNGYGVIAGNKNYLSGTNRGFNSSR